jgi:hypothetical protein
MAKKKPEKREVHFSSYGVGGLRFECCNKEWRKHIASKNETRERFSGVSSGYRTVLTYSVPTPKVRANLRQVTCPECWKNILAMAVMFAENLSVREHG